MSCNKLQVKRSVVYSVLASFPALPSMGIGRVFTTLRRESSSSLVGLHGTSAWYSTLRLTTTGFFATFNIMGPVFTALHHAPASLPATFNIMGPVFTSLHHAPASLPATFISSRLGLDVPSKVGICAIPELSC